jgi:hypothetical protein
MSAAITTVVDVAATDAMKIMDAEVAHKDVGAADEADEIVTTTII